MIGLLSYFLGVKISDLVLISVVKFEMTSTRIILVPFKVYKLKKKYSQISLCNHLL